MVEPVWEAVAATEKSQQLACFQNGFSQTRPKLGHRGPLCELEEGALLGQRQPHRTSVWLMGHRVDFSLHRLPGLGTLEQEHVQL